MVDELILDIQNEMIPYLDEMQMQKLGSVLAIKLKDIELASTTEIQIKNEAKEDKAIKFFFRKKLKAAQIEP